MYNFIKYIKIENDGCSEKPNSEIINICSLMWLCLLIFQCISPEYHKWKWHIIYFQKQTKTIIIKNTKNTIDIITKHKM